MLDLLIRGGTVMNGREPPVRANVAIEGDTIVDLGPGLEGEAQTVLDAAGMVVSPGFVDIHGHDDLVLTRETPQTAKVTQGVTTEVIGNCGFLGKEVDGSAETELIYVFAKEAWGRGFAAEAARALCTFAFEQLGVKRLIALIDPENEPSARVAEKAGMGFWKETVRPTGKRMRVYRNDGS